MASEDVLERAFCSHRTIDRATEDAGTVEHLGHPLRMVRDVWSCRDCGVRFVPADSSAAEVRELRKDKARLDWMLRNTNDDILSRVDLDAAMEATEND